MPPTPRPQRKAAVAGEFKRATAGVPDRDSRPTKPPHAPTAPTAPPAPAVVHAPVEGPSKPPMYRAGRQKKALRPKPPPPTLLELKKMTKDKLIDYHHVHHLQGYKGALKDELMFTVRQHMHMQALLHGQCTDQFWTPLPSQPTYQHVAHLTQLAQVAPLDAQPVREKKQARLLGAPDV
jgi:hypothetical protein